MSPTEVLIGIQARSNSTRFPGKIYELIGETSVLDLVIAQAQKAADHVHNYSQKYDIRCRIAVLHPENDTELVKAFKSSGVMLIAGSEHDVLSRYVDAQRKTDADYVVRLTSDCPLMKDYIINKHINSAIINKDDYVNNVDEECRFIADGFDCEILSRRAIQWLDKNAITPDDREHVTKAIRRLNPISLKRGLVAAKIDTSHLKMSVDTPEDLERMRNAHHEHEHKTNIATMRYGKNIYWL